MSENGHSLARPTASRSCVVSKVVGDSAKISLFPPSLPTTRRTIRGQAYCTPSTTTSRQQLIALSTDRRLHIRLLATGAYIQCRDTPASLQACRHGQTSTHTSRSALTAATAHCHLHQKSTTRRKAETQTVAVVILFSFRAAQAPAATEEVTRMRRGQPHTVATHLHIRAATSIRTDHLPPISPLEQRHPEV